MDTARAPATPPFWKKALKAAAFAMLIGVATGLIGGTILPGIAESLAGSVLPVGAPAVFTSFPPSVMGMFFGVTGAISAVLTVAAERFSSSAAPSPASHETRAAVLPVDLDNPLSPTHRIGYAAALPILAAQGVDGGIIAVSSPIHHNMDATPSTAVLDAVHESRLQAQPELATLRLH